MNGHGMAQVATLMKLFICRCSMCEFYWDCDYAGEGSTFMRFKWDQAEYILFFVF